MNNSPLLSTIASLPPYLQEQAYQYRLAKTQTNGWQPYDWQRKVLDDRSFILLLTGSAGGGKSRMAAELIHRYMATYPHSTGLMLRKAREFASKSIVPFLWHTVIGRKGAEFKKSDSLFQYPNGSTLFWGGMKDDDQRESLRSIGSGGGLDSIWIEEANAFTEDDFNELMARMRGRAGDYRQIILTTNPDAPNHWINRRLIIGGEATVYYSSAVDNPANPPEYLDYLNRLTGTLHQRLVQGLWVQSEGVIFDNFRPEFNVTEQADYNPAWDVMWGVDDGYAAGGGAGTESYHPRVILFTHDTPQGGVVVFDEYYRTQELSEVSVDHALAYPYKAPYIAYVDSSALELKARIHGRGIQTVGATHPVSEGIKNVRRLICDGEGVRLLTIHPRCVNLIRELQSYRYAESMIATVGEPKPKALDDHGPSSLRYLCWHLRYNLP